MNGAVRAKSMPTGRSSVSVTAAVLISMTVMFNDLLSSVGPI